MMPTEKRQVLSATGKEGDNPDTIVITRSKCKLTIAEFIMVMKIYNRYILHETSTKISEQIWKMEKNSTSNTWIKTVWIQYLLNLERTKYN
jgi:hypothetical protein